MLARGQVHERSIHHDGLASQVVAAVASQVTVFNQTVAVRSASRGREAACAAILLHVGSRGVADTGGVLVLEVDRVAVARGVREGHGLEHVAEVSCVVAAAGPVVVDGRRGNHFVAVQVAGTHAGTGSAVDRLGDEGNVVRNTVGVGGGHAGYRAFGILQDDRGSGDVLGCSGDVGLERDIQLAESVKGTASCDFHRVGVDRTFDELHGCSTGDEDILGVGHDNIGQRKRSITIGFNTNGVVLDGHAVELNGGRGTRGVLERRTCRTRDGTGKVATDVGLVVDTSHGLVLKVEVLEVHLTGSRVGHEHTVVAARDVQTVCGGRGLTDNFQTGLAWPNDVNVFEVASSERTTDFDTGGGARDGAFLEERRTRLAEVRAQVAWVVAGASHEVVAVLVVVRSSVKDIHPKVDLGDVSAIGDGTGDVHDGVGQASALSAVHVVGVGVVKADTVVVGVATSSVAGWVSNVSGLAWSSRGLTVATFGWSVGTAEVERRGVVAPVLVWVAGLVVARRTEVRGFPAEAELVRCFVVVRVAHRLTEPVAVEVVEVALPGLVVGSVAVAVVVAMPGWCTTGTAVVGVGTCGDRWVVATVGVVTLLAAVGDVPLVTSIVLEHDVHSVGDEVVLARSVVVAWVSVSTGEDRVGTNLQVVARAQVGGQVDLVGGPAGRSAREGRTSVDGWQRHTAVGVDTDGVARGGEAVHLRGTVVALNTDGSVLDDDVSERCTGVLDPNRRTGLTGVDDAGGLDVGRAALDLDRGHLVSVGR